MKKKFVFVGKNEIVNIVDAETRHTKFEVTKDKIIPIDKKFMEEQYCEIRELDISVAFCLSTFHFIEGYKDILNFNDEINDCFNKLINHIQSQAIPESKYNEKEYEVTNTSYQCIYVYSKME